MPSKRFTGIAFPAKIPPALDPNNPLEVPNRLIPVLPFGPFSFGGSGLGYYSFYYSGLGYSGFNYSGSGYSSLEAPNKGFMLGGSTGLAPNRDIPAGLLS